LAAELFNLPSKALDANANPYSGATAEFYQSGTSTPQAVYADADLVTSLGATLTADSTGKFQNAYLNSALSYRCVVKNADGSVTLHDIDPFNPSSALTDLSSPDVGKGADLVAGAVSAARAEDYGALADGAADDAAALQDALDTGRLVYLRPDKVYAFGSQLNVPEGGGFFGGGTLKMLTGAGKFDASAYTGAFSSNVTGIYALSVDNIVLECKVEMQANAGIRVCHAIAVRDCQNIRLDVEASSFKEMQYGAIAVDSSTGFVRAYVHDITPDSTSLATMQLTGLAIDGDRIAFVNSNLTIDLRVVNVLPGVNARATYGAQSDACNIQSQGYAGIIGQIYGENVGEVLDVFGDGCNLDVVAKNAYAYGVKIIHGASDNVISVTVVGTCGSAVVYGSSNSTTKDSTNNVVTVSARDVGTIGEADITVTTNGTTTIDVTAHTGRQLAVGMYVRGTGIPGASQIASLGTGTGGTGTYVLTNAATTTASGVAMLASRLSSAAVSTDGTSGTYHPKYNHTFVAAYGDGIHMDMIVDETAGENNSYEMKGTGWGYAFARDYDSTKGNKFKRVNPSIVRAYIGTATTITNGTIVPFDTEVTDTTGEYNPATGVYTANSPGWRRVYAQVRIGSVATLASVTLGIYRNGGTLVSRRNDTNEAAGNGEIWPFAPPSKVYLDTGQTIDLKPITAIVGAITVSNDAAYSFLEIEETC
jgi:hypothetical protein